jgi:hypothetical protein
MRIDAVAVVGGLVVAACTGSSGDAAKDEGGEAGASPRGACAEARKHEDAKDYAAAREAYAKCLGESPGHVDTHAAYQKILVLEEGEAGARKVYDEMVANNDDDVTKLARARLLERPARIAELKALIARQPDFTPAYYELSLDYSAERLGQRSLGDQAEEKRLLEAFTERAEGKAFVAFYADYDIADAARKDAAQRLSQLGGVELDKREEPVTMIAMASNAGWTLTFQIAEPTKSVSYRLHDEKDFTPVVGNMVTVPLQRMTTMIYVKYEDQGGVTRGPFEVVHEPRSALAASMRTILDQMPTAWVSLRDYDGKLLLYWTMLLTYRCGIEKVEYGFDTMTPTRTYDPGECDPTKPYEVPTDDLSRMYIEIPTDTKYVSVRLVYPDGTESKVHKFQHT